MRDHREGPLPADVFIPVEQTNGPILLVSGGSDGMWPASRMAHQIMERLAAHKHPFASRHVHYPNAGHLMRPPGVPTSVLDGKFALGGTAAGQASADRGMAGDRGVSPGESGTVVTHRRSHSRGELDISMKWWQVLLAGVIATASMDVLSMVAIRLRLIALLSPNLIDRSFASVARAHPLYEDIARAAWRGHTLGA